MYKIAICDDDIPLCSSIEETLLKNKAQFPVSISTDIFYSADSLARSWEKAHGFDLVILDIEFDGIDGIRMGNQIRKELAGETCHILYISAKQTYAMELFDNRPLNFLIKPISADKLIANVQYAISLSGITQFRFNFVFNNRHYSIICNDILFFESKNKTILCHMVDGTEYSFVSQLSTVEEKVPENLFLRIHKSYLINMNYVRSYSVMHIELISGKRLPISQSQKKNVREMLLRQMEAK